MPKFNLQDRVRSGVGSARFGSDPFDAGTIVRYDTSDKSYQVRKDADVDEYHEWYLAHELEPLDPPKPDPMQLMDEVTQYVELIKGIVAQFTAAGFDDSSARALTMHLIINSKGAK